MANNKEKSVQRYARIAGASYIITMLLGIFGVNLVESNLIVPGNDTATVKNISENELLFRLGFASEVLMYLLVILLAFSLYVVLKNVDKNLSKLALLWRIGEAIIGGATTVVSGFIPLWLVKNGAVFEAEELETLVKIFLDLRSGGLDVVLIFIGMGGTIFSYLFYKSEYIPKILAAWGVLTYISMLLISFTSILIPVSESTKMIFFAPGGLFELILGLWLLIKGVKTVEN